MIFHASNYTRFAAGGAADQKVFAGNTIKVIGIICANTSASAETVLIEENDGSTAIQTIRIPANDTIVDDIPFVAKNGITVTPGANTSVTVYHTHSL